MSKNNKKQIDIPVARQLYEQGHSTAEIAARFGVAPQTVGRRLREAGIRVRRQGEKSLLAKQRISEAHTKVLDEDRLRSMAKDRLSTREMGEILNVSEECVRERMVALGIPRLPAKARPERNTFWRGGRVVDADGYVLIKVPDHPHVTRKGYVREHRLVMEEMLGRFLSPNEVVHHKNGNRSDNRPENLEVFERNGVHLKNTLAGKRPNWSEDGERRILEGLERGRAKLLASRPGSETDDAP